MACLRLPGRHASRTKKTTVVAISRGTKTINNRTAHSPYGVQKPSTKAAVVRGRFAKETTNEVGYTRRCRFTNS